MMTWKNSLLAFSGLYLLQLGGCAAAVTPYVAPVATAAAVEAVKDPQVMHKIGDGVFGFFNGIGNAFSGSNDHVSEEEPRVVWENPEKPAVYKQPLQKILPTGRKVQCGPKHQCAQDEAPREESRFI